MALFRHFWPDLSPRRQQAALNNVEGKLVLNIIFRTLAIAATISASVVINPIAAFAATGCGGASWYAAHSKTASGERMNASTLTAAHRSLAFGTRLRVTNKHNGKSVVVRVNDRGPFIRGRVLDLSRAAAQDIGMVSSGTANICYSVVT
ncbi:septal ring lytic transglycosylase RlpA family protein [Rhizobium sp. HT1-10]|uniref:septal ring lytic transglycosylase RlpA family protein n=1 Tax=Rhizobium sp. HT1-10 TaxID=3111638 RepID=UPI003C304B45